MADDAAPATTHMSDDPSNLHVAVAILTRHISDWGLLTHPAQETLIENAAKAMLDAVDNHIYGGGGTDVPPEVEPPPEAATASTTGWADEEAEDEEDDAKASAKGSKKRKY